MSEKIMEMIYQAVRGNPAVAASIKKLPSSTLRLTLAGPTKHGLFSEIITKEEARAIFIALDDYFRSEEGSVLLSPSPPQENT